MQVSTGLHFRLPSQAGVLELGRRWMRMTSIGGAIGGIFLALLITLFAYQLHLNLASTGFLQLLAVLATALKAGFWQATVVSLIANGCLNYFFIPPTFTFSIADPQNWVALLVFEVSALVVSRSSSRAQREALRAAAREGELARLYDFSRQLLLINRESSTGPQILKLIQGTFHIVGGVLFDAFDARVDFIGEDAGLESATRKAYLQDRDDESRDQRIYYRVLRLGVRPVGAIGLQGHQISAGTANAIASLSAIALERTRSLARQSQAEAERQAEQLRTTVLDALAHEYKTPLTVVRTGTSGLLVMGQLTPVQAELLTLIDSETAKLDELTTRLLQMSRLEAAQMRLHPEKIDLSELVTALIARRQNMLAGHLVELKDWEDSLAVCADRELVTVALTQLLDNAAKYSPPGGKVTMAVHSDHREIRISVHNPGPCIPREDRERIFQRFYRSPAANRRAAGSGLGLSIAKKIADLHGARIWYSSEENEGNTFFLALPRAEALR